MGALAMLLCALTVGAMLAFAPVAPLFDGPGLRLPGMVMAAAMCGLAFALRVGLRWPTIDLMTSLVAAEMLALCIIGLFSGLTGPHLFDNFNLRWLARASVFVAPPWLAGLALGSVARRRFRPR